MSKAILVIDMPKSCSECPLFVGYYSDMNCKGLNNRGINYPYPENFRQKWCPLKEAPNKLIHHSIDSPFIRAAKTGYNTCIDEILGE